jgi:hypothetical protein
MHAWQVGDEAWGCDFDAASSGYVGRRLGRVTAIGNAQVSVLLTNPDQDGRRLAKIAFHDAWPSQIAVDDEIARRPQRMSPAT